jgi:hemoglobin
MHAVGGPVVNPQRQDDGVLGEASELGGGPPCWEGRIVDHHDNPVRGFAAPQDLSTPAQVHDLVTFFYREIVFDELLEPMFSEVAEVDWAEHIPKLIDYWCWILFGADGYPGAVTRTHRHLHETAPITAAHCTRWFTLWVQCIDARWRGPYADQAKAHAQTLMAGMAKHIFGYDWQPAP